MKRHWDEQELAEHWSLRHDEFELLRKRTERSRIGFAVLLKFFQIEGRFPSSRKEVPAVALDYLGDQLEVSRKASSEYEFAGRSSKRDREQIRSVLGFHRVTVDDSEQLVDWLRREVFPLDPKSEHLQQAALDWCRRNRMEPPTLERILRSALKAYENDFFIESSHKIPSECRVALDALLCVAEQGKGTSQETTPFAELRADPGPGSPGDYPNLQPILTRPINWELIRRQYDEMVKYATALRLGTAETETILRRFTRDNIKHPTYQALAELGKVKKTIFLCRYLHVEALRQEVQEGYCQVKWNSRVLEAKSLVSRT